MYRLYTHTTIPKTTAKEGKKEEVTQGSEIQGQAVCYLASGEDLMTHGTVTAKAHSKETDNILRLEARVWGEVRQTDRQTEQPPL